MCKQWLGGHWGHCFIELHKQINIVRGTSSLNIQKGKGKFIFLKAKVLNLIPIYLISSSSAMCRKYKISNDLNAETHLRLLSF